MSDNDLSDHGGPPSGEVWVVLCSGLGLLVSGLVSLFLVKGHDGPISAAIVMGAALIFTGTVLPRLIDEFEIGPSGIKGKLANLRDKVDDAKDSLITEAQPVRELTSNSKAPIDRIVSHASSSPEGALMLLGREIERESRRLFSQTGWIPRNTRRSLLQLIREAEGRKLVPLSLTSSLEVFWDIRNSVAHSAKPVAESEVLSAIDMGVSILRMLQGIPHETHVVFRPAVQLYSDDSARELVPNYAGVILRSTSPGGTKSHNSIFPTRRADYEVGQAVGWEWDSSNVLGDTWYRDPVDGAVKKAWDLSAEFVGEVLAFDS